MTPPWHIVLVHPLIPPNTGNIARLCAVTGARLHLVSPLGFRLDDSTLKRAGMDYWKQVDWCVHPSSEDLFEEIDRSASPIYCIETCGHTPYWEARFTPGGWIVLGCETTGLSQEFLERAALSHAQLLRIPMPNPDTRSLNLSNCAAIVLYEAIRQQALPHTT